MKPKERIHYVNNRDFSNAVMDYVKSVNDAEEAGEDTPVVTDYIATSFMKISEGLSHSYNFLPYPYRDEMVMDAVENCLRAIRNYNIEAATRTGRPNAFAYFTQIAWFAFLRRIAKEKRQSDIKFKYIEMSGFEDFITSDSDGEYDTAFIEELRQKLDIVRSEKPVDKKLFVQHKILSQENKKQTATLVEVDAE
jgi:DNA-directed RNA polymerase specialized sigma24 family protein